MINLQPRKLLKYFLVGSVLVVNSLCTWGQDFWLGGDISATTQLESQGIFSYNKEGVQTENTLLMKQLGLNAVRLRVWVNPKDGWSSKEDVLTMALRAKKHNMAIMIDFHYSDWWADPGKQIIPAAWKDLDYAGLKQALVLHTEETLALLKKHDIDIKWVQVGNETTNGFLWGVARVPEDMTAYADLTKAGCEAVKRIYPESKVIIHLDKGYNIDLYTYMFDSLKRLGVQWDIIGMSIYPFWYKRDPLAQSSVDDCISNINALSKRYDCELMVVETGVKANKPPIGYVFLKRLILACMEETNNRCTGVFYWAPECCHGGYSLGAFQNDRPTVIMDAFKEASSKINKPNINLND